MNEEQKQLFHRYEEAKRTIKEAELIVEELKPLIAALVPEGAKIDTGTAQIYWKAGRAKWEYSQGLQSEVLAIEDKKKEEEQTGVAKQIPGAPYIECKIKKGL